MNQQLLFGANMIMSNFLREEDLCSTVKKDIAPLVRVSDFAEMYKEGGRPPLCPKVLIIVTLLQYLEGLSDRAAAFNLRFRIDWKIALGLEIDDEGLHYSSLSRFRDRLLESDKASHAFDVILQHLVTIGLVKKGAKQRIDSTHVIAKVRDLSRLELLQETLRLFCNDAVSFCPAESNVISTAIDRYKEQHSTYQISADDKKNLIRDAGMAMRAFIEWVGASDKLDSLREISSFKTLKLVYQQNFIDDPDGDDPELIKIATGKDHICSPHEPEARYGNKGGPGWIGYKAQIGETIPEQCENGQIISNFITFAEVSEATDHDSSIMADFLLSQQECAAAPSKVYGDTHYNTEANITLLLEADIDLRGPVMPMSEAGRTKSENVGFTTNMQQQTVTCPEGCASVRFSDRAQNKISATFSQDDCNFCKERSRCKPAPRGKNILIKVESHLLMTRRAEMQTEEFKREMYQRNGIEGTLSGLVRGQRLRNARYRGKAKVRLGIKMAAASANVKRLHLYYQNKLAA